MVRTNISKKSLTLKTLALGAVALLVLTAAGNTVSEQADTPVLRYVFDGQVALDSVFANYGSFQTAWLNNQDALSLANQGVLSQVIDMSVKRGQWTLDGSDDAVPADLRDDDAPVKIVQFMGPVKAQWRDALQQEVERVYDVIPHNAFLVRMDDTVAAEIATWNEVHFVGDYHPAYKLSDDLEDEGVTHVTVLTFPGQPMGGVIREIHKQGGTVSAYTDTFARDGIIKADLPAGNLEAIASLQEVSWIEPGYGEITLDNAQASAITQSGGLSAYSIHDEGVDGSSQVISVCDTGLTTDPIALLPADHVKKARHTMFDDEVNPAVFWNLYVPGVTNAHRKIERFYGPHDSDDPLAFLDTPGGFGDTNGHGTHVTGTIAGSVAPYDERVGDDGIAYNAKLAICDIYGPPFYIATDYTEYWKPAYETGARINSNSWGQGHTDAYTQPARMHDEYVWEHQDFLILRSAGNAGTSNIRISAVAKSVIGVGATQNGAGMENLASFSSRGPAEDGRIKPNLVAPGQCLNSAGTGTNDYRCISGTSMSTPAAAGAAGLVRDYFERGFHPSGDEHAPSSALVRGLMQMSGKEITGSNSGSGFPNKDQGWGRVLLEDVLAFDDSDFTLFYEDEADGVDTGETATFDLDVAAGEPLRIMLAWNDYPAVAGANPAIINDLDLEVTGPDGDYIGNAFVGSETPPNQGSPDRLNVEEAVYVDNPTPGTYTVTVRGANVPEGPQPFALSAVHG